MAQFRKLAEPVLVDVDPDPRDGPSTPGYTTLPGELTAWRKDDATGEWQGSVRPYGATFGGTWTPGHRLHPRGPLTRQEIAAARGIPAAPDGEPDPG